MTNYFTQPQIDLLTNFNNTYIKMNPKYHPDYKELVDILDKCPIIPDNLIFKVKLQYALDVINGKQTTTRYFIDCSICSKHFKKPEKRSTICSDCVSKKYYYCKKHHYAHGFFTDHSACQQCEVDKSHKKFENSKPGIDYVTCPICDMNSGDLASHYMNLHGLSKEQYQGMPMKPQVASDRVKGANNPAYQHGGKFSPFSKNFVKYNGLTDEEISNNISKTVDTSMNTRSSNDNCTTTLEYYIKRGMSEQDAKIARSKRQRTFSLQACIDRHGEEEGTRIWQERQVMWMATMNAKTDEEKATINRKKSTKMSYETLWSKDINVTGMIYVLKIISDEGKEYIKIGVTTQTLTERYTIDSINKRVLEKKIRNGPIGKCFQIEQLVKYEFFNHGATKEEQIEKFGWTEVFHVHKHDDIEAFIEKLWALSVEEVQAVFNSSGGFV